MNVTVLGSGSWGTALSILLARNGHSVTLIGRNKDELAGMNALRQNARYLPKFDIPSSVRFASFDHEPSDVEMTVVAVPSSAVRQIVGSVLGVHPLVVVASKGLETESAKSMCESYRKPYPLRKLGF
jgi:glycerol-3-phosphate dehydrogenase (NAD(P)+)